MAKRFPLPDQRSMFTEKAEHLRWFMLPSEAQDLLLGHSSSHIKQRVPFSPAVYYGSPRTSESSNVSSPNSSLARYNSLSALDHRYCLIYIYIYNFFNIDRYLIIQQTIIQTIINLN